RRVDRQPVFAGQMRDDGLAVADGLALVDEIGQLSARRRRRIENVLMHEGKAGETQEREDLQPIAVVVGDTEEHRIGVQRDHDRARVNDMCILLWRAPDRLSEPITRRSWFSLLLLATKA